MTLSDLKNRPHWSFSSLNQILNICSLQYYFEKVLKLRRRTVSAAISFGSAFHHVAAHICRVRMDGNTPDKKQSCDLFTDVFSRQLKEEDAEVIFGEDETQDAMAAQGRAAVGCIIDAIDPQERVVSVNEAFAIPMHETERPVIGELDLAVEKDGLIEVVDFKTACRRWSQSQADRSLQPTIYLNAYAQVHGKQPSGFRYDVIIKNKQPVLQQLKTNRTQKHFDRLAKLVQAAERIVEDKLFYPAEQGYFCSGCAYAAECSKW